MSKKPFRPAHQSGRRQFVGLTARAGAATLLVRLGGLSRWPGSSDGHPETGYTVQEIIQLIIRDIPGAPLAETVDTLKAGDPNQRVTGIVSTMFCTVAVIEEAVRLGANFIIAHEPTFYNHEDNTRWVEPNSVLARKQALLKKHSLAVWRFHDYWHMVRPDGITYGVLRQAGWLPYDQDARPAFRIPPQKLGEIVSHLKKTLGISHVRVIGDMDGSCEKILLLPGAVGGQTQISLAEKEKPDLLIVGEVHEWETAEYIRDARQLGDRISLLILGHVVSEEPGMDWLPDWLQPKLKGLRITHVPSRDPMICA